MLHPVLPTATTDEALRIVSADPGFSEALARFAAITVHVGDSLIPVVQHQTNSARELTEGIQELQTLLDAGHTTTVALTLPDGKASAELIISPMSTNERLVTLVADALRPEEPLESCDDSEAELATLASRLQAVLASAVELDSSIHDTQVIYRAAFNNLAAAIPFDTASIQLLQGDQLEIVACVGFAEPQTVMDLQFPVNDRFPNYYVITGKTPLALDDIRVDFPHFLTSEGEFGSGHIRSWLGVPLLDRNQVVGMVTMDRATLHPFDPDEIELAQALANHAAVALSNARMYESLQHANELQYMLLRELHHRVKNNLQLVSSLLNLRSKDLDKGANRLIEELRTHIQALAATHDNIFQPGLSEDIMLQPYVDDIARGIEAGYAPADGSITIVRNVPETARCGMELAVPLGLITSELVLNAVKHAFPENDRGMITVAVTWESHHLTLTVEDDGVGFPPNPSDHHGFGMTLISTLSQQVEATLHRETSPGTGTRWTMTVVQPHPDPHRRLSRE